jgi:hypothetical protein
MPSSYGVLVAAAANNCTSNKAAGDMSDARRSWHWRAGALRARVPARARGTHTFLRLAQR